MDAHSTDQHEVDLVVIGTGPGGEAVAAGADIILLDNMTPARIRAAVKLIAGHAQVEVSGGVTFQTLRRFALPGVNFISVGALTHSVTAADLSLDLKERIDLTTKSTKIGARRRRPRRL